MKAIGIRRFGGPDVLELLDLDPPEVGPEDVLIATRASGVGPWDTKLRAGQMGTDYPLPFVIGFECAGVVERVGQSVGELAPGDEVFSYGLQRGTYAQLVAAPAAATAPKPRSASFEEAAALPLAGTTAHQTVVDDLALRTGETLLVTGASGGVGGFAVQIASTLGAHVIATGRPDTHDFLRGLGAAEAYPYSGDFVEAIRAKHPDGVDALLDCVAGETLPQSLTAVRDGGRAVTLLPPAGEYAERGIRVDFVYARPDGGRLRELARLVDEGKIRVELEDVLPLEEAARAHELIEAGNRRGKLVLQVA